MDTARLVRCISSTTQAKVYHLSIRLIRALGYAANREEENMHRRHANPLHAFALGGQPGETGLHSNINQTATEASVNPIQLVCKTVRLSTAKCYSKSDLESSDSPTAHGGLSSRSQRSAAHLSVPSRKWIWASHNSPKGTKPRKPDAVDSQPAICESALGDLRELGKKGSPAECSACLAKSSAEWRLLQQ